MDKELVLDSLDEQSAHMRACMYVCWQVERAVKAVNLGRNLESQGSKYNMKKEENAEMILMPKKTAERSRN